MNRKPTVIIGLLGTVLDQGPNARRWEKWRPTVSLCQHEDFLVDRLELLHPLKFKRLAVDVEKDIAQVSPETLVNLRQVEFRNPWDFEEVYGTLHDFARSYPFDPEKEDYLIHITTGSHVAQICLFLLAESRHLPGRLIQTGPPNRSRGDEAPGVYSIIDLDLSRYDRIASRFQREKLDDVSRLKSGIDTRNDAFNRMIDRLEQVAAQSTAPILLMGPTGAGKSLLARRIYELKQTRRQVSGAFVEINCATIRGESAMSALFGHIKGAFTGALKDRPGLLREADGGVLFLDEIGELGPDEQAMLLRAIEEKRFLPLGADREAKSDFQLLAGTNRDLPADVRQGRFREDLLARINLWMFRLPGLKERIEDIEPNVDYELEQYARRTGAAITFNREARERFLSFGTSPAAIWPANFRDLNGAITRMGTLAPGCRITVDIVDEEIRRLTNDWNPTGQDEDSDVLAELLGAEKAAALDRFDAVQLAEAIRVCRKSRSLSEAGRALFSNSRTRKSSTNDADRLRKYLAKFDLGWEAVS